MRRARPNSSAPVDSGRRALLSGIAASGAALAFPGLIPAACAQPAATGPVLRSSAFRSFGEAVARWSRAGGVLIVDRDHVEPAPIMMVCVPGLSYRLTSEGARTISYGGPHFHWLLRIHSTGQNPFVIDGDLTFDGRSNCSIPFSASFERVFGAARRDFSVDGLTARNARMRRGVSRIDGSPTDAFGAAAMNFHGGFDRLHLRNVRAFDVSRDAGAGRPGSQGSIGIGVIGALETTASARHVTIEDFEIARIDSDDRPGSPQRFDIDGLSVFQAAEAGGSRPIIQRGTIREAAGRAIKVFAPGGGGVTRDIIVHRSVHGITDGSNDIAHQHGDGVIENIVFHYSGNAHSQPTYSIGMSAGHVRARGFPFTRGVIRNVTINDTTGRPKGALVALYASQPDPSPRAYLLADITDSGSARQLLMPGRLGDDGPAAIVVERVSVNLTAALILSNARNARLTVTARGLVNRAARAAPFRAMGDGRPAPIGYGGTLDADATVRGVDR